MRGPGMCWRPTKRGCIGPAPARESYLNIERDHRGGEGQRR